MPPVSSSIMQLKVVVNAAPNTLSVVTGTL